MLAVFAFQAPYPAEIARWRHDREARLTADDGWLTLAGLFWLRPGANSFGTAADAAIALPDGPAHAGVFTFDGRRVTLTMDGATREMTPDSAAGWIKVGRLSLFVIQRGDKFGIRLKDPESSNTAASSTAWSISLRREAWRITARWVASPKKIPILNILGQTESSECPGYAEFELGGKSLAPVPDPREVPAPRSCSTSSATKRPVRRPTARGGFFTATCRATGGWCWTLTRPTTLRVRSRRMPPARCRLPRTGWRCASKRARRSTGTEPGAADPCASPAVWHGPVAYALVRAASPLLATPGGRCADRQASR